jgi:hypothetical protein
MHISVLFNYTESVIPPRCRKPRTVTRDDGKVDVSIPVLAADQAPVAIRVTGNFMGRDQAFSYELRWWEGQLWSPISLDNAFEPRGRTTGQDNWDWPELPEVIDLRSGGRNLCHTYDFQGTYGSNPIEDVEADIHAFAKRHTVIDGIPHRAVAEPRYVTMTFGLSGNHGGTVLLLANCFNINLKAESYFGLLELEAALSYATQVAEKRGDTKSLPMRYAGPTFDVLVPEMVTIRNPLALRALSKICEFGTAPEQALAGYKISSTIVDTEEGVLALYEGQDMRLVRGAAVFGAPGKQEFAVMVRQPIRHLLCSCCGGVTRGRQWSNRDDGYGLCVFCIDFCSRNETPERFQSLYGVRGVHFDVPVA